MIDLNTPLIEIERPTNADELAKCIAAIALSVVGLTGRASTRDRFAVHIGPVDAPESDRAANARSRDAIRGVLAKVFGQGGISTCGMVAEGIHARLGAGAATLYRPYVWGTSVSRAVSYLSAMHAWVDAIGQADIEPRPQLGAYVVIGCTRPKTLPPSQPWDWGGIEHVRTVVGWDGDQFGDDIMVSVDGGTVDPGSGLQAIQLVRSRLVLRRGHPWLVRAVESNGAAVDPGSNPPGRRILGWGDPGLMTWRDDLRRVSVPEEWKAIEG